MGWHLDEGYFLDSSDSKEIACEVEFTVESTYTANPFAETRQLEVEVEFGLDIIHGVALDLLPLIPAKFKQSQILLDYVDETELVVGDWLTKVQDITKLLNARVIATREYLRHLGALIGVNFPPEDESTIEEMRKTLLQAIDWYRIKGTYESVHIISLIQQFTVNLYDMYTNDYSAFYITDWFVGNENENPPGFDSSYYKSPHFGIEILLDKVYSDTSPSISGGIDSLWESSYLNNLHDRVEETRPVHTVPHFILFLNPKTDEFGNVIEVDGEIRTKVTNNWEYSTKYFDMQGSVNAWNFDDGTHFDQSAEAFAKSVQKYVLGTGNYPCTMGESGGEFSIENPVLTGSIDPDDIVITKEKVIFEFIVPKATVQNSISELGLYIPGSPDKLVVGSCFPKIQKDSRVELRVQVEIFKRSLYS